MNPSRRLKRPGRDDLDLSVYRCQRRVGIVEKSARVNQIKTPSSLNKNNHYWIEVQIPEMRQKSECLPKRPKNDKKPMVASIRAVSDRIVNLIFSFISQIPRIKLPCQSALGLVNSPVSTGLVCARTRKFAEKPGFSFRPTQPSMSVESCPKQSN